MIVLLCFSFSTAIFSQQGRLTGKLTDEKGKPLGYANVTLLKSSDTSFVDGGLTDTTGKFTITTPAVSGTHFLRFSAIGFAEIKTAIFAMSGSDFSKDFGTLTLKANRKPYRR